MVQGYFSLLVYSSVFRVALEEINVSGFYLQLCYTVL